MSKPLKRALDPVDESGGFLSDLLSDVPLHPSDGDQVSLLNLDEADYNLTSALTEWGNHTALPDFDPSQSTPISSQEISRSPSVVPDSIQQVAESVTWTNDEETICYGMLHNVDVKLVGKMRETDANLGESEAGDSRFELNQKQDHLLLRLRDNGKDFGYLRSGVGKTLAPLLAKSYVELEPILSTPHLKEAIGRANQPAKLAETLVKVDINVYGPRGAATEVGGALSRGKLWLQKSGHARRGVAYDNPHFLPLNVKGIQMQAVQPVNQTVNDGLARKKHRKESLRKMVEEVYKSLDNTRHLDMVEGGNRVTRKLLKHQQEALGFMLERESGHINDRYRLWETVVLEDGREEYRHRITKARAKGDIQPDERGGGILADEMGMGKSMSILALIAKTLDDGNEWAQQHKDSAEDKGTLRHSRSTLVVVPSTLLIHNWMNEIKMYG